VGIIFFSKRKFYCDIPAELSTTFEMDFDVKGKDLVYER
jgi:hypothetical protein